MTTSIGRSVSFEDLTFNETSLGEGDGDCGLSTLCQKTSLSRSEILMLEAAQKNDVLQMKVLVKKCKVNVDVRDNMGRSSIHWAAANGSLEALETLMSLGASLKMTDKYGMTPLLWACWFGHINIIISLVKLDVESVSQVNKQGLNALHCAVLNNHNHVVEFICDCLLGFKFISKEKHGRTALHLTSVKGNHEIARMLLGINDSLLEMKDEAGCTALHYACAYGQLDCVKVLLKAEVDISSQDLIGQSALHYAAFHNHPAIVKRLMKHLDEAGLNKVTHAFNFFNIPQTTSTQSPENWADPNLKQQLKLSKNQTALMLASGQGHVEVVGCLVRSHLVDVNIQDERGNTACHLASRKIPENVEVMKRLLWTGRCDVSVKNNSQQIPLHVAVEESQLAVAELLLKAGSKVISKTKSGKTPLMVAVRSDDVSMVDLIIKSERIRHFAKDLNSSKEVRFIIKWRNVELDEIDDSDDDTVKSQIYFPKNSDGGDLYDEHREQVGRGDTSHAHECHEEEGHESQNDESHNDESHIYEGHNDESHNYEVHNYKGHNDEYHNNEGLNDESHNYEGHNEEGHSYKGHNCEGPNDEGRNDEGHNYEGHCDKEGHIDEDDDGGGSDEDCKSASGDVTKTEREIGASVEEREYSPVDVKLQQESLFDEFSDPFSEDDSQNEQHHDQLQRRSRNDFNTEYDNFDDGDDENLFRTDDLRRGINCRHIMPLLSTIDEEGTICGEDVENRIEKSESSSIDGFQPSLQEFLEADGFEDTLVDDANDAEDAASGVKRIFWKVAHKHMKHGEWKKLARHWSFTSDQIKAIESQYATSHKHRNHGYRLLLIWYECFRDLHPEDNPTKELYESFVAIGNRKLAEKLRRKLNSGDEQNKRCIVS